MVLNGFSASPGYAALPGMTLPTKDKQDGFYPTGDDWLSARRRVKQPLSALVKRVPGAAGSQNEDPGVFRKSASSSLEFRPSIALRCG